MGRIEIDNTFFVHSKSNDVHSYTHLERPIHKNQNVQFEDASGITTWADEIDYGRITNFGWDNSGYNIDGTYVSLINAMQNCINALHERIYALEHPTVVEFFILPSMDEATGEQKLSVQNITGGEANNTSWEIVKVGSWKNNASPASPYLLQKSALTAPVSSITNASQVLVVQNTLAYPNEIRGINKIKVGSSSYSNASTIPVHANTEQTFSLGITLNTTTTYKCKVKATNGGTSQESGEYSLTPMQDPDSYEWYLTDKNGNRLNPSAPNNNVRTYPVSLQLAIVVANYNTAKPSITLQPNNLTNDISFRLYCKISSGNLENAKYVTFNMKAPEQQVNYYWYAGVTQPTSQNSITPQDDAPFTSDNWHTINDINATYSFSNPLYNSVANPISGNGGRTNWYVAVPSISSLSLYDSDDDNEVNNGNWTTEDQITVKGVTYNVYKSAGGYPNFNGFWIH